jgi:hypothetical protein
MQVKAPSTSQRCNQNPTFLSLHLALPPPPHFSNQTRRGELSGLQTYLPPSSIAPQGTPVLLAGVPVHEQGPLARCSPFMDAAARRVLPGHLLRRARVLSSLQVGGGGQRVAGGDVCVVGTGSEECVEPCCRCREVLSTCMGCVSSLQWLDVGCSFT